MTLQHVGLVRAPFGPTPDPGLYVPAASHERAFTELRRAFEQSEGMALLDGISGIGKTLVLLRFLEWLPEQTPAIVLPSGRFHKPAELFQAMLFDLQQPWQGLAEAELRLKITELLLTELAAGRTLVLAIDEAHHLAVDVLEELRLLGNLEKPGVKGLFVLLSGLPVLRDRLDSPWLAPVAQRIGIRSTIDPLSESESVHYLHQRLELCGVREPDHLLPAESAQLIAEAGQGIPRLLNRIAATSLALAFDADQSTLDVEAVLEAMDRHGLSESGETTLLLPEGHAGETAAPSISASSRDEHSPRTPKLKPLKRKSA